MRQQNTGTCKRTSTGTLEGDTLGNEGQESHPQSVKHARR